MEHKKYPPTQAIVIPTVARINWPLKSWASHMVRIIPDMARAADAFAKSLFLIVRASFGVIDPTPTHPPIVKIC